MKNRVCQGLTSTEAWILGSHATSRTPCNFQKAIRFAVGLKSARQPSSHLEGPVEVVPDPVALNDLYDGAARLQEGRVGQVGGVHAHKHPRGSHCPQLLLKRRRSVELHHIHLNMHGLRTNAADLLTTCGHSTYDVISCLEDSVAAMQ